MDIPAFGQFETALRLRAQRNELLASNIANADTPNYKARDIDFASALSTARGESLDMQTTSDLHRKAWNTSGGGFETLYRVPHQTSLDGNTLVFTAGPDPKPLAQNILDDSFSASAALVGQELILRGDKSLYCIAETKE